MSGQQNSSTPCPCTTWHKYCNPSACMKAKAISEGPITSPLSSFRDSAKQGCRTCATVNSALLIPDINKSWMSSIQPALESQRSGVFYGLRHDEGEIRITLEAHSFGRRLLRTAASDVSVDWRHFHVWQEDDDDADDAEEPSSTCRAITTLKHHPVERTDSPASLEHLKHWIRECDEEHSCYVGGDLLLPTRVVLVTDNRVRVVNSDGRRGGYATLSHRWGPQETFKLTSTNIHAMMDSEGLPWDSIPKTFQDAISVVRHLDLQYLWIDMLCIIQDNKQDWKQESTQMRSIYGGSYINIANTHGEDSQAGLFVSSDLPTKFPTYAIPEIAGAKVRIQPHMTQMNFGSNYNVYDPRYPLLGRGWVLQECFLSPRVVYYSADELQWECGAAPDCQCGGMVAIANFKREYYGSLTRGEIPLPYAWMRIAERYSHQSLTYDGDRLVALAGVADRGVQSGEGGRYLAGLWERSFAHQVCWEIMDTHRKPNLYLAPSWSWLSVFGLVSYDNRMDYSSYSVIDVDVVDVSCASTDGTELTTSTSPVLGSIQLNGRGLRMSAKLTDAGSDSVPPTYELGRLKEVDNTEEGGEEGVKIWIEMDYVMTLEQAVTVTEIYLLFWGSFGSHRHTFLALRPTSVNGDTYERFGIIWFSAEDKEEATEMEGLFACCEFREGIIVI